MTQPISDPTHEDAVFVSKYTTDFTEPTTNPPTALRATMYLFKEGLNYSSCLRDLGKEFR